MAGGKIILEGGKIILAGGKNILAGGKIILAGGKLFWQTEKLFWQVDKLSTMKCVYFLRLVTTRQSHPVPAHKAREFLNNGM